MTPEEEKELLERVKGIHGGVIYISLMVCITFLIVLWS